MARKQRERELEIARCSPRVMRVTLLRSPPLTSTRFERKRRPCCEAASSRGTPQASRAAAVAAPYVGIEMGMSGEGVLRSSREGQRVPFRIVCTLIRHLDEVSERRRRLGWREAHPLLALVGRVESLDERLVTVHAHGERLAVLIHRAHLQVMQRDMVSRRGRPMRGKLPKRPDPYSTSARAHCFHCASLASSLTST